MPTEKVQYVAKDGTKLYRCPSKYINPEIKYYIDWYFYFKQNRTIINLPILRYPAKLLEIFDIIERTERLIQDDKEKFMKEVYDRSKPYGTRQPNPNNPRIQR